MGWFFIVMGITISGAGLFLTYYGQQILTPKAERPIINYIVKECRNTHIEQILVTDNDVENTIEVEITTMDIIDENENMASIEISVVSKEAYWAYESSNTIFLNEIPLNMPQFLRSSGMQARFNRSVGIVVVGAASEQGNILSEEKRAKARARQLVHWLREIVVDTASELYTLSLGRFLDESGLDQHDSALQRRIVIISITKMDDNIDLSNALKAGLSSTSSWPFKIKEYSQFHLEPAT